MNKILPFVLLAAGVVLIAFGVSASDSIASSFSRMFTGAPTDKTTWLLIIGLFAVTVGLVGALRGSKS